jgi:hypothetical protein
MLNCLEQLQEELLCDECGTMERAETQPNIPSGLDTARTTTGKCPWWDTTSFTVWLLVNPKYTL